MNRPLLTVGGGLALIVLLAAGGGYFTIQHILKGGLSPVSGEISLPGLKGRVEIVRDRYGIPHIYAENEADLFYAQGYAMAQDRFWQMEFYRRLGSGRLAEILGQEFIETDRYFRMITASGMNSEVPGDLSFIPRCFSMGINAYLETNIDNLPLEFRILGYEPEPWGPDDFLFVMKVINWGLSSGWRVDPAAGRILGRVGEERFREAFPAAPGEPALAIPEEVESLSSFYAGLDSFLPAEGATPSASSASNNWVVSGKRSSTGRPLLANDTHLPLSIPPIWWEAHLSCPTMEVGGFALAGTPGISIGRNRHTAWGVTNVMVDDVDFYVERINPQNPRQYWYGDHWEDMGVVEETIQVKGEDPQRAVFFLTRHGPVVSMSKDAPLEQALSVRWAFTEFPPPVRAVHLLNRAGNVRDIVSALRNWTLPSQNFVFADDNGEIGHWCCAAVPIRLKGDGLLPAPGWKAEFEWGGYLPFEERPHALNPEGGFLATANNSIAAPLTPNPMGRYWEPADRISRITEMLSGGGLLSISDFKRMQLDVTCPFASELTPLILAVLKKLSTWEEAKKAAEILSRWDGKMTPESPGACLFEVTFRKLMENTFKDEMGATLFEQYLKTVVFPVRALEGIIRKGDSPWFDDTSSHEAESLEDLLARSLSQAFLELTEELGNDMAAWTWGSIHTLTFEHALGAKKPLNRIFNLGPFPVGGSHLTVNKKQYPYENPYEVRAGASQRMIVDLADPASALHVLPPGESGHLKSPHRDDQLPLYLNGEYHPLSFDRKEAERDSEGRMILKPEPLRP